MHLTFDLLLALYGDNASARVEYIKNASKIGCIYGYDVASQFREQKHLKQCVKSWHAATHQQSSVLSLPMAPMEALAVDFIKHRLVGVAYSFCPTPWRVQHMVDHPTRPPQWIAIVWRRRFSHHALEQHDCSRVMWCLQSLIRALSAKKISVHLQILCAGP